jgi:hypothetical protein
MKERLKSGVRRRDMLAIAIGSAGASVIGTVKPSTANAKSVDLKNKRKARYQADSAEVRNFYRVNAYPAK